MAIVSNHIHIMIRGRTRRDLQNFFRVVAGHIAQELLHRLPILQSERTKQGGAPKTRDKENKFWQTRIYSRIVSWGSEYSRVKEYVVQNALEALGLIPYKTRAKRSLASKINFKNTS